MRVRPTSLAATPGLWTRLGESADLVCAILDVLDVWSICSAKAADKRMRTLCETTLRSKPVRELYEYERRGSQCVYAPQCVHWPVRIGQ